MKTVRIGVIGVGVMGGWHARALAEGQVNGATLAAVCDASEQNVAAFAKYPNVAKFSQTADILKSADVDAVVIATPHYAHTVIGIAALKAGKHVLVEKPISVHKADCERLLAAHKGKKTVFAAMFNQRTNPCYRKLKALIDGGELGQLVRVNWIITDWFRSDAYYSSGTWRATWKGEGGGVLVNQCPHQLDLLTWLCGMPMKVRGFCGLGKRHNIEVEDEVTAYLEYENGATGVFITSTGETPGTNRLEICGEMGKVVVENGAIRFTRNEVSMTKFSRETSDMWARPDTWNIDIPISGSGGQHLEILQNFTEAIAHGKPLIAPASEGMKSVELANAMLYSSLTGKTIEMPLNSKKYEAVLNKLIRESTFVKKDAKAKVKSKNVSASFRF
jgi:predicted dehydrogenase